MNLRTIEQIKDCSKVILRMDTDLPIKDGLILDNSRLKKSIDTIVYLLSKNCKIMVLGHMGRPDGKRIEEFSLRPAYLELATLLSEKLPDIKSVFIDDLDNGNLISTQLDENNILFGENTRFWPGEESNEPEFLKKITNIFDCFVNDAFAVAHRNHASICLHRQMNAYYGFSFIEELNKISRVTREADKPVTIVLGGAKKDKLDYLPYLDRFADFILVGGKLPKLVENEKFKVESSKSKVIWAKLNESTLDLNESDIAEFEKIINQSKTIIWAGAMGYYESENCRLGTESIAKAIANNSGAYKIIAGGDTSASVTKLGLSGKVDYVCSGGGVMLEFLSQKTLPALE